MKPSKTAFIGYWRIEEMDNWDQEYIDMDGSAHITFKRGGLGELHFGCGTAQLDWRYDPVLDRVDFTFEGNDECDPSFGRGWAKLEGKKLIGFLVFHLGDESGFKAKKGK